MYDLISIANALEDISSRITKFANGGQKPSVQDMIDDTVDINRAAYSLKVLARRWTPISEREPFGRYLGGHILVTLDDGEVCELDYGVDKATGGSLWARVIAWMPMPEPYEGE